jgi:arsenate reductase (thioredoxin)
MNARPRQVLFLCTGNSARSILAESILDRLGSPGYRGFSAGSHPKAAPHPLALEILASKGHETANLRSNSWDEFAAPGSPAIDLVVTVCDNAAGESCPIWPGRPMTVHWGLADPAAVEGSPVESLAAFEQTYQHLVVLIEALLRVEWADLEGEDLASALEAIAARMETGRRET